MIVGILKEIKTEENRVCMTPAGAEVMKIHNGHQVLVEKRAGVGSGFEDSDYAAVGAELVATPQGDLRARRHGHARKRAAAFGIRYDPGRTDRVHLPAPGRGRRADPCHDEKWLHRGIAYETIQKADRSLPLLTPMSEVAGRMAIQEGAKYLEMPQGARGSCLAVCPVSNPPRSW
jgi:alanine dehydrogenase